MLYSEGPRTLLGTPPGGKGYVDVGISYGERWTNKDILLAPYVLGAGGAGPHCQVDSITCYTLEGQAGQEPR